ncbi:MAG: LysR family transcriptional regulator [Butyricicoccaceae bacterium]
MTLQQLKYIVVTAECGNITEAAEKLFIAQPSLTAAIHNIETEMGITAFIRSNKGVELTRDGEVLLSYARQILEQTDVMTEHFKGERQQKPRFSVSSQHYSFAVNAFVDVIRKYDAEAYRFTLRETQTYEIIDDVAVGRSEIGILYLSEHNEAVLSKLIHKSDLQFEELFQAKPHVFISNKHPLANQPKITVEDLLPYPYLVFEQGKHNSFYFSEEFLSMLDLPKNIMVRDRATLFNLLIGLNGFTVSSGVINTELNGHNIIARPLESECKMRIGTITRKNSVLSRYGTAYIQSLKKHLIIG